MKYVSYDASRDVPNVIVDGAANDSTVLTLSHWPGTLAPTELRADLSAQMAFRFLDWSGRDDVLAQAQVVSNNHFDQDGLVGIFTLVDPEAALERRDFLIDVAAAGDFGTFRNRDAARVSMAIAAWPDPDYDELLGPLVEMCDHPDHFKSLWADEDAELAASEAAIVAGRARIEEVPALDLAIVTIDGDETDHPGRRFTHIETSGIHPMAVYNATDCFRVLLVRDGWYEFTHRYETWVQYQTRRPLPRVDLTELAAELTTLEPASAQWTFDPVGGLTPRLSVAYSELAPEVVRSKLETALASGAPAWNPYVS